jgi:hypothetical protein
MLPEVISEALWISLSEVLDLYFGGTDEDQRDRLVWDAIDRCRMEVENHEWLEGESRRQDHEDLYRGEPDDTY